MSKSVSRLWLNLCALVCLFFVACGGGSSGGGNQIGGIDGSGSRVTSTAGTISGFGSVIVNGIRYHSDKATITLNDLPGTEDDLRAGYQVHITGTLNTDGTGDASAIEFHSNITGTISALDSVAGQFTLLGQTVLVTNATLFGATISPNFIDGLKIGDKVQVTGPVNQLGIITATRIDLVTSSEFQVMGTIENLNTLNSTFSLNNLTVNFASASLKDVTNNQLQNGVRVFVKGTLNNSNELVAQSIKQLEKDLRSGSNHGEVEGFIHRFASVTDFDVGDATCTTNDATTYEGGTRADLKLNAQIEVEGNLDSNGKLVAAKIQFRAENSRAIAGLVSSVVSSSINGIFTGTLMVSGTSIKTSALTRLEDKSSMLLKKFNLSDVRSGDFLKVAGYTQGDEFIATQIERQDVKPEGITLKIEGIVTATHFDSFSINERNITLTDSTELRGLNGVTLTRSDFLNTVLNKSVEVRGILMDNKFTATRVEMNDD